MYDYLSLDEQARRAEKESNWGKAARLWYLAGRKSDSEACVMIYLSSERGDQCREFVRKNAGVEPEVEGDKQDSIKWMAWFKKMDAATKKFDTVIYPPSQWQKVLELYTKNPNFIPQS